VKRSLRLVARSYKGRKCLRFAKRAKKMWKILKGRSFVKAQTQLKLGGGQDLFCPGKAKESIRLIT